MLFACALSIAWYAGQVNCACVMIVLIAVNAGKPDLLNAGSVRGYCWATREAAVPKFSFRKMV